MSSSERWEGRRRPARGARAPPASRDKDARPGSRSAANGSARRGAPSRARPRSRRAPARCAPGATTAGSSRPRCTRPIGCARWTSATRGAGWPSSAAKCATRGVSASSAASLSHFTREPTLGAQRLAPSRLTGPVRMRSSTISPNSGRRSPLTPRRRTGLGATDHSSSLARIQRSFSRTKPSMSRHGARSGADTFRPSASTVMPRVRRRRRTKRYSTSRPASRMR